MKQLLTGIMLAVAAANASAVPVTIDADNYSVGTNVSSANNDYKLEVVHRTGNGPIEYRDVIIREALVHHLRTDEIATVDGFGENAFGYERDDGSPGQSYFGMSLYDHFFLGQNNSPTSQFNVMGIRFFEPVQYLSLKGLTPANPAYLRAYDANGNFLNSYKGDIAIRDNDCYCTIDTLTVQRNQADIAYVIVGGSGEGMRFNEFTYDVPAPSSIALLLMGVAGGVITRARKAKAV